MAPRKPCALFVSFVILSFALNSSSKPLDEANIFVSWLKRLEGDLRNRILSDGGCEACKVLTLLAQGAFLTNDVENSVIYESRIVCKELKIEDNRVCTEVVSEFKNEVLTVVDKVFLSPSEVCGSLLGPTCAHKRDPSGFWNVTIPEKKPPVKPIPPPKVRTKKYHFLYLNRDTLKLNFRANFLFFVHFIGIFCQSCGAFLSYQIRCCANRVTLV